MGRNVPLEVFEKLGGLAALHADDLARGEQEMRLFVAADGPTFAAAFAAVKALAAGERPELLSASLPERVRMDSMLSAEPGASGSPKSLRRGIPNARATREIWQLQDCLPSGSKDATANVTLGLDPINSSAAARSKDKQRCAEERVAAAKAVAEKPMGEAGARAEARAQAEAAEAEREAKKWNEKHQASRVLQQDAVASRPIGRLLLRKCSAVAAMSPFAHTKQCNEFGGGGLALARHLSAYEGAANAINSGGGVAQRTSQQSNTFLGQTKAASRPLALPEQKPQTHMLPLMPITPGPGPGVMRAPSPPPPPLMPRRQPVGGTGSVPPVDVPEQPLLVREREPTPCTGHHAAAGNQDDGGGDDWFAGADNDYDSDDDDDYQPPRGGGDNGAFDDDDYPSSDGDGGDGPLDDHFERRIERNNASAGAGSSSSHGAGSSCMGACSNTGGGISSTDTGGGTGGGSGPAGCGASCGASWLFRQVSETVQQQSATHLEATRRLRERPRTFGLAPWTGQKSSGGREAEWSTGSLLRSADVQRYVVGSGERGEEGASANTVLLPPPGHCEGTPLKEVRLQYTRAPGATTGLPGTTAGYSLPPSSEMLVLSTKDVLLASKADASGHYHRWLTDGTMAEVMATLVMDDAGLLRDENGGYKSVGVESLTDDRLRRCNSDGGDGMAMNCERLREDIAQQQSVADYAENAAASAYIRRTSSGVHADGEVMAEVLAERDDPCGEEATDEEREAARDTCCELEGRCVFLDYWAYFRSKINHSSLTLFAHQQLHVVPYLGELRQRLVGRGRKTVVHVS